MANVLTNLAADIYTAKDRVSRELTGMVASVTMNANGVDRVAAGDVVRSAVTPVATPGTLTFAMTIPEGTDQTIATKTVTMGVAKGVLIPWTGEDMRHVRNGNGYETIYGDQIAQAMRGLVNLYESDLVTAANLGASRAYGTAGTTPFATQGDLTDASLTLAILKDNGANPTGNQLVLNSQAGGKFLGLQGRYNVQGNVEVQNQGVFSSTAGLDIRESSYIPTFTKGTGTSYTSSTAGFAVGATSIAIITGSGTVLAGDVVTFAGDTNKYIVATGVSGPGTIVLQEPGLRVALPASAVAMTIGNTSTRNMCFNRSAIELIVRPPAMPDGGDAAVDAMTVIDERSGLPFEIRAYKGFGKAMFSVSAVWAVKVWKPEHTAILLG